MDGTWRIGELCRRTALALDLSDYGGQDSARVREVPDVRTIRYYTSAGLLDRPTEIRGRVAYYGVRHLLKLAAIKRMQSQGLPLFAIQLKLIAAEQADLQELAGLSDKALQKVLNDPEPAQDEPKPAQNDPEPVSSGSKSRSGERFWERTPELPVEKPPLEAASGGEQPPRPAVLLPVCEGASLLLDGLAAEHWQKLGPEIEPALALLRQAIGKAIEDSIDNNAKK